MARKKVTDSGSLEAPVVSSAGDKKGTTALNDKVFGAKIRVDVLHEVTRWQRAKKRAGTHSVQTRAEASGGGVKPWKQKGTGRARAGSNTSAIWVGGGVAHGPRPRSYDFSLNKKQKALALRSALSAKQQDGAVLVVEEFPFTAPKTKSAVAFLRKSGIAAGEKALIVLGQNEGGDAVWRSLRNIAGVKLIESPGLNVYDVLNAKRVVFTSKALSAVQG